MKFRAFYFLQALICLIMFAGCRTDADFDEAYNEMKSAAAGGKFIYPDRYNTGCISCGLRRVKAGDVVSGVPFTISSGDKISVNFWSRGNDTFSDGAVVENCDFTGYSALWSSNYGKLTEKRTLVFRNCLFNGVRNDAGTDASPNLFYIVFENCTFNGGVNSSNITMKRCLVRETYSDGCNPLKNFVCTDSYFENLLPSLRGGTCHVDGLQIYGDSHAYNLGTETSPGRQRGKSLAECRMTGGEILFDGVRMEIPSFNFAGSEALKSREGDLHYVNACIMFQLEFYHVNNVTFRNMKINGGGYTVYIQPPVKQAKNTDQSIAVTQSNIVFENIQVGCNHKWGKETNRDGSENPYGMIYPTYPDSGADVSDIKWQKNLYVTSVFHYNGRTCIVVTNDTARERKLTVSTEEGTFDFFVPANCSSDVLNGNRNLKFSMLPVDRVIELDGRLNFIKCFEGDAVLADVQL